jgi:hypothetical protein
MRKNTLPAILGLIGAFLCVPAPSGAAAPADPTMQMLLSIAAPNRTEGTDERPNVLFIIVDDLNVALGSYLDSAAHPQYATAKTPNIDRLAAQGVLFERAYVQYPLCNPSRTSLLSGLRPSSVDVFNGATPPRHKIGNELRMLPEHFDDHGYFTARVGKVAHNRFEDAVTWDVSKFALSRQPELRFHDGCHVHTSTLVVSNRLKLPQPQPQINKCVRGTRLAPDVIGIIPAVVREPWPRLP